MCVTRVSVSTDCAVYVPSVRKQVAQLSQRDRAAGWVSYVQKWKTGTGRQYFTTLYHCDVIGQKTIKFGEKTQNKGYYAAQGHSRSSRSVSIESLYATSN